MEEVVLQPPPDSLNAASAQLPAGAYTTFRTYGDDRALPLEGHIQRLQDSARLAGVLVVIYPQVLRQALHRTVRSYPAPEKRVRITLDLTEQPGTFYISIEPLETPPPEAYRLGAWVVTAHLQRRLPQAKLTDFIAAAESVRADIPPGANEALMVNEQGEILEGLSSNFFAVRQGEIYTAGETVLPGITRALVLALAQKLNIPVHFQSVTLSEVPALDEAFITSSSRSVLPVVRIDDQTIASGKPGPITQALMQTYQEAIQENLIEI